MLQNVVITIIINPIYKIKSQPLSKTRSNDELEKFLSVRSDFLKLDGMCSL